MSKLFVGFVDAETSSYICRLLIQKKNSGLAWHTTDDTLRDGFARYGPIEEAVSSDLLNPLQIRWPFGDLFAGPDTKNCD